MGPGCQGNQTRLEGENFSRPTLKTSSSMTNSQCPNQLHLYNESSIKAQKDKICRASELVNMRKSQENGVPRERKGMEGRGTRFLGAGNTLFLFLNTLFLKWGRAT